MLHTLSKLFSSVYQYTYQHGKGHILISNFTPCNFCLSHVYVNRQRALQNLKANVRAKIADVTPALLESVMTNGLLRMTMVGRASPT